MNDLILILNYAQQFALETARRLRAEQVYCQVISGMTTAEQIRAIAPRGIILSGDTVGGQGVLDAQILTLGIPILAMGHAAHMLLAAMGGASAGIAIRARKALVEYGDSPLFAGVMGGERYFDEALTLMLPADVRGIASACGCTVAFADATRGFYGAQFGLERNDPEGTTILRNFARDICGCSAWFTVDAALQKALTKLEAHAAQGMHAVCAVSGGVDSAVTAILTHRAFGERMTALYVDTGLMREGECALARAALEAEGVPLRTVDRSGVVLDALAHKRGAQEKREVVFAFLREEIERQSAAIPGEKVLVLGTHYGNILAGSAINLWRACGMPVCEPLNRLFKEDVRAVAERLGLPEALAMRKPFPMVGLGARILGEVTGERLHILRTAETIFTEELTLAGLGKKLYKAFPILADSTGLLGGEVIILRAVALSGGTLQPMRLPYDLVERTVERIRDAAPEITRVFYDETPTPLEREAFL